MELELSLALRIVEAYRAALVDEELRSQARIAVADTLSVAAAAPGLEAWAGRLADAIAGPPGDSMVLGVWRPAGPWGASVANALLAHALEYDDWLAPGLVHAGSIVVPIAASHASCRVLEAVVAGGYEAALQAGSLLGRRHYRAWHATATAGAAAAAATAVLALAGPEEELVAASIGLAGAYMGGLWVVNESRAPYKPLSPAHAVQTGLLAAHAALEHGEAVPGLARACEKLEGECRPRGWQRWALELNGYKFYPSCRHSHTSIEAAVRLHQHVDPGEVELVEVVVFEEAARVAGKRDPGSLQEARFSIPHLVALALLEGRVGLDNLPRSLQDPRVARLRSLVELRVDPDYTRAYPERQPATVRVHARGRVVEETVENPLGDPARPPTGRDIIEKARGLARAAGDERIASLAEAALEGRLESLLPLPC